MIQLGLGDEVHHYYQKDVHPQVNTSKISLHGFKMPLYLNMFDADVNRINMFDAEAYSKIFQDLFLRKIYIVDKAIINRSL